MINNYIVATIKPWNIKVYDNIIKKYNGNWHLITKNSDLNIKFIKSVNPKFIFFPHWSNIVDSEILNIADCICFHETDLPYGRGGSPIQNLIKKGHKSTVISAIKMIDKIDAGPIYLKSKLSLEGTAEEIYDRSSHVVAKMIETIIKKNPIPYEQTGQVSIFKRRTPDQSIISDQESSLSKIYDHIRMLDADTYPKAFIEKNGFVYEFSKPIFENGRIKANVQIIKK